MRKGILRKRILEGQFRKGIGEVHFRKGKKGIVHKLEFLQKIFLNKAGGLRQDQSLFNAMKDKDLWSNFAN